MLGFMNLIKIIKKSKSRQFIIYELTLVILFAVAYHVSDIFLYNHREFGKRLGLGVAEQIDDLYSYFYFSLITQSTVGFGGVLPDGNNVITTKSNLIKFLSVSQLISVICMTAWCLSVF